MAYNVSALPEYVNQHADELLTKSMLEGTTLDHISIMPNVKYKDSLTYLETTVAFQDASVCGFNPNGTDTLSQRTIEVAPIKVNKEYCPKDLRKTALNHELLFEAGRERMPFEEKFMDGNIKAINAELEKEIWQNGASALFPGFLYQVTAGDASVGVVDASLDSSGNGYTAIDVIDAAYSNIPNKVFSRGEVAIFVSMTTFRNYVKEMNATCCANRQIIDAGSDSILYLGDSRVRIIPVAGLENATDANSKAALAMATWAKNLVYGTDVKGSENTFRLWFSDDDDVFKFKVLFNAGTAVAFPDEVVYVHEK